MKRFSENKGVTLAEVLLYTALFSILAVITIYVFIFLNRLYRVQFAKTEELERISRISRDIPLLIQSVNIPSLGIPAYISVPNVISASGGITNFNPTPGYLREVAFWRVNRNNFNPLRLNLNSFEEWRIGFRSPSPDTEPWNDGFLDIFPVSNPANRTTFGGLENVQFRIFNSGQINNRGDSLQIEISVFERKFSRRIRSSYVISGR